MLACLGQTIVPQLQTSAQTPGIVRLTGQPRIRPRRRTAAEPGQHTPPGCTTTAAISRYDVYQYEIATGGYNDHQSASWLWRNKVRHNAPARTPTADRRILNVAVINCGSSPVTIQSNATNVPVAGFARFFLTVAPPEAAQAKPYAEFRGLVKRGEGIINDQVQLYR